MTQTNQNQPIPKTFVCGWPIEHSRSPLIHSYWLKKLGISGAYEKITVEPKGLQEFLLSLKSRGYVGGNITIPHKQEALLLVDKLDKAAEKIGAVNTVWFEDEKLVGGNTDWVGFAANLDQWAPGWDNAPKNNRPVVVLGAGGAARGILYALLQRGLNKIYLANRTISKAEALANDFGQKITPIFLANLDDLPADIALLINTTSLGMSGKQPLPTNLEKYISTLGKNTVVCDIVYTPIQTELLKLAEKNNLKTVDGLGMLLHQAAPGFEKWFGAVPQVTEELREMILADIDGDV